MIGGDVFWFPILPHHPWLVYIIIEKTDFQVRQLKVNLLGPLYEQRVGQEVNTYQARNS